MLCILIWRTPDAWVVAVLITIIISVYFTFIPILLLVSLFTTIWPVIGWKGQHVIHYACQTLDYLNGSPLCSLSKFISI